MLKLKYYSVAILSVLLLTNTSAFAVQPANPGGAGGGLTATQADLDAEVAARIAADDAEITARTTGDSKEATARTSGDNTLQTNIDAEATARTAGDNALQTKIDTISLTPGPKGDTGTTGLQGVAGADSTVPGPAGADGTNGAVGAMGPQGPAGVAAPDRSADICVLFDTLNTQYSLGLAVPDYCTNQAISYNIGDTGPAGGIVFYITDGGLHGMEVAPVDQSTGVAWGCNGTDITGAVGTAMGTGAQNTAAIVAGCAEAGTPAKLADAYVLNGYTDWFLPSKDELMQAWYNLGDSVGYGSTTIANNLGGFITWSVYWSSSQYSSDLATYVFFGDYEYYGNISKDYVAKVRAVRAF